MRGPIDYIVIGFTGNRFKGDILAELAASVEQGVISVLDLAVIAKAENGSVAKVELVDVEGLENILPANREELINEDDIAEIADVLDDNCSAGLLIIEHLWAKGLKKAILDADGVLLAEGRIHPDAYTEVIEKGAN
ncbi:DUF1269 domain-containing protein [bacterium]|nr:MAG: DUF1269 domain-containing protein [bacterium]